MNPYSISGLLAGVFSFAIGALVLVKSQKRRLAKIWFLFATAVAVYGFGSVWIGMAKSAPEAVLAGRCCYAFGVIWTSVLFYHFVCVLLEIDRQRSIAFHYFVGFLFLMLIPTNLMFSHARWVFGSMFFPRAGLIFPFFVIWWAGLAIYSHVELIRAFRNASSEKRNQISYFFIATAIGFTGGSLCYLPNFEIDLYPWGNFAIFLYPCIMSYAILRHRLLDVRLIIRKTLVYSLLTAFLAGIYISSIALFTHLFEHLTGHRTVFASIVAACAITGIFHPLRSRVQAFVDRYFPRSWMDREAIREVAAGFSHELKSPLAGLSMQAQLALAELLEVEEGRRAWIDALPKIKCELQHLVNKTIDVAQRIEAVRGVAEPAGGQIGPVEVAAVLDNGLTSLESRLCRMDLSVRRTLPAGLPLVLSNEKQLEIVFINLIKNALDAMEENDSPNVLWLIGMEKNGSVLVSIKDTGAGIASKDIHRIFDPSFTTKGRRGMGMGLYLTQQIVQAHGGSVEVKSEEGKGTEFVVCLPKYVENGFAVA